MKISDELKEQGRVLNEAIKGTVEFAVSAKELATRLAELAGNTRLDYSAEHMLEMMALHARSPVVAASVMRNAEDEMLIQALLRTVAGFLVSDGMLGKVELPVAMERADGVHKVLREMLTELVEHGYGVPVGMEADSGTTLQ